MTTPASPRPAGPPASEPDSRQSSVGGADQNGADQEPGRGEREDRGPTQLSGRLRSDGARVLGLLAALAGLAVAVLASIAVGTRPIAPSTVVEAVIAFDPTVDDHLVVQSLRVPRTVVGVLVGSALGAAGALMQGLTRNPLADPGILGVSAGAALFVVVGINVFGVVALTGYAWFALAGAAVTSAVVYGIGSVGRDGATPVRLALAGAAITAFLTAITTAILILDRETLDAFRFWAVGSLAGRDVDVAVQVSFFLLTGLVAALAIGGLLNVLSLGDDLATSLGMHVGVVRFVVSAVVVLLVGGAVAAAGPIGFVGLAVPHVARVLVGPNYWWVVPYAVVLAPLLLLTADVIGRVVARPGEIQVGVVTAFVGAPVFIALVRRRRLASV